MGAIQIDQLDKIANIVKDQMKAIEKKANLTPLHVQRENFAKTAVPTGCLSLDTILGGGIPAGRIIGIAGPERAGKSLLVTQIAHEHLKLGGYVVYLDAEGTFDPIFLKARGIDFDKYRAKRDKRGAIKSGEDRFFHYQPETGEQARDYMFNLMAALPESRGASTPPVIFILDSVIALIPKNIQDDLDSNAMSMHARMYASMLPILQGQINRTSCTFIYTNQLRQKPGVKFGSPEYEPAGDALQFFSSIRLRLSTTKPKINDKEHPLAKKDSKVNKTVPKAGGVWVEPQDDKSQLNDKYIFTSITTQKNKVYKPYQVTWMRIQFQKGESTGHGLDPVFDVFTLLAESGILIGAIPNPDLGEKASDVAYQYEIQSEILSHKDLKLEPRFTYWDLKKTITDNPKVVETIREKLIASEAIFDLTG